MARSDRSSRHRAHDAPPRANRLQIAATVVSTVFIVSLVLYGLNNQRDENESTAGGQQTAAAMPAVPQPAQGDNQQPGQKQAQAQQGTGEQPSAPSSSANQPSAASSPSSTTAQTPNPQATTTGQGPNPQGSPGGNAGNSNKASAKGGNNPSPGNASPSVRPPNQTGNQYQ